MGNNQNNIDAQSIKSQDRVALLMENLWLRHKAGLKQRSCNVYMVKLPPLTEEEFKEIRKSDVSEYDQEELFGGFV